MAQSTTTSLATLYSELNRFGQSGDYDKALKAANKILQEDPDEDKAFHCKIVCLIQLSKFDEVLKATEKNPKLSGGLVFERAYCLYRVNRIKDAWDLLKADTNSSFRNQELMAQVLYRLEKFEECFDTYRSLIKNSEDDYEDERETNMAAVLASLSNENPQAVRNAPQLREHTYELCYNGACILLAQKKHKEAAEKLKIAEDLCRKTLEEEDTPEEDIDEELGVIRCQTGYSLQLLGQKDKALSLYNLVLRQRPSDAALVAVASNNIVTINKDQNVFESKKRMKAATAFDLSTKLTSSQRCAIALNQGLFLLHTNQLDLCRKHLEKLQADFPVDTLGYRSALIRAAILCRDKQFKEAVSLLKEFLSAHPDQSLHISLTLSQLLLSQGQVAQACQVLQSLGDLSYKLGLVSALVTLYGSLKDKDQAGSVLKNSLEWHRKNNSKSSALAVLIRESAHFFLRNGQAREAAAMLEEQRRSNPNDPKILAQLISAYSQFDQKKSKEISQNLLPLDEISKHVDVASLENSSWSMGAKYIRKGKVDPSPGSPKDQMLLKQKKKRRRKGKLPKNYDPNVDPDPERWLPRRERSTYKKKKDRRGGAAAVGKGTQGAVGGAPELDITKGSLPSPRPGGTASIPGAANQSSSPNPQGPRQQRPQPVIKKKKKKGGRW